MYKTINTIKRASFATLPPPIHHHQCIALNHGGFGDDGLGVQGDAAFFGVDGGDGDDGRHRITNFDGGQKTQFCFR